MSMERIDFLLARAEATLRAAAADRHTPSPAPVFSRVIAADPAIPTTSNAGALLPGGATTPKRPSGSRSGYADEMRRLADKELSVGEVLAAKTGRKAKGGSLLLLHTHTPRTCVLRMKIFPYSS